MASAREIFSRPALQWVLFFLGMVLFHWPFLAYGAQWPQPMAYYYLLAVWVLMVLVLYLFSQGLKPRLPRGKDKDGQVEAGPDGA